jgi:hypothetical protein
MYLEQTQIERDSLRAENGRLRELLKKIDSKLPYNARMVCDAELGEYYMLKEKRNE